MQLDQIFKIEFINANLLAQTKTEALTELVNTIIKGGLKLKSSSIIEIYNKEKTLVLQE